MMGLGVLIAPSLLHNPKKGMMDYKKYILRCCGSNNLVKYLDLGEFPWRITLIPRNLIPIEVLLCMMFSVNAEYCRQSVDLYSSYPIFSVSETFRIMR